MEQMKTHQELLDELVHARVITQDKADELAYAPRIAFSVRELVTYLAGLIIAVGVIRIISVAFEDASEMSVCIALYFVAAIGGFISWKLSTKSELLQRFGEVLEVGSVGAALGATALAFDQGNMRDEWIAIILSSLAVVWGAFRISITRFAGTVVLTAGVPALAISLSQLIDQDNSMLGGVLMLLAGVVMVALGVQEIHAPFIPRAAGSMFVFISSMMLANEISGGEPLPIITGALMFAAGSLLLTPEMLMVGAICVVAGIVMSVSEWVHNDMAQGFVIVGTGLAVLLVLSTQMRRVINQPKLGVPTA
jgi:hypothetical protein